MNFQQLRIIQEAVRRNFNLTEVANALFTSQGQNCIGGAGQVGE